MVGKAARGILYMVLFAAALLFFLPKSSLYYALEHALEKQHIVIGDEALREKAFALELDHADIYVEGVRAAKVMHTEIHPWLLYNSVEIRGVRLESMLKEFLPTRVERLDVEYALWDPLHLRFFAYGDFGKATGSVDLLKRHLEVSVQPSKSMRLHYAAVLGRMRKAKEGGFVYEQSF